MYTNAISNVTLILSNVLKGSLWALLSQPFLLSSTCLQFILQRARFSLYLEGVNILGEMKNKKFFKIPCFYSSLPQFLNLVFDLGEISIFIFLLILRNRNYIFRKSDYYLVTSLLLIWHDYLSYHCLWEKAELTISK